MMQIKCLENNSIKNFFSLWLFLLALVVTIFVKSHEITVMEVTISWRTTLTRNVTFVKPSTTVEAEEMETGSARPNNVNDSVDNIEE